MVRPSFLVIVLLLFSIRSIECAHSRNPGFNLDGGSNLDTGGDGDSDTDSDADTDPTDLNGYFPATVTEDYARTVYNDWVTEWIADCGDGRLRVEWDTQSQTVSEGIGYGMLLAASWEDQATFDGLFSFYESHLNANGLMNWKVDCNGTVEGDAASDADLDVAMSLIMADYTWPGSGYGDKATELIGNIREHLMMTDGDHEFLCAGDSWGGDCCGNASYQAPAYYRAFGLHTGDTAYWDAAAGDTYYYLDANNNDTTGLVSDWMDPDTLKCNAKGWGDWHGWDASRVPWRVVTDFIWWGNAEAEAYSITIADFVVSKGGVAQTCQGYNLDGTQCGATPAVTTFAGAFASSGIAKDQATVDDFFDDLKTVENNGYFNEILNALYFTTAAKRFRPGCY